MTRCNQALLFYSIATLCVVYISAAPALSYDLDYIPRNKGLMKRSPYLRLDELATKLYLAKNKLGGGIIDPLEIGKRSMESNEKNQAIEKNEQTFEDFVRCLNSDACMTELRTLLALQLN